MIMIIEETYKQIINDLKQGKRPSINLDENLTSEILEKWQQALTEERSEKVLTQIFCLLEHAQNSTAKFDQLYTQTFLEILDPDVLVYAMGSFHKQVLARLTREGNRVGQDHIESIKALLSHPSPEVLDWTLRTIEQFGMQGLQLKEFIREQRPGVSAIFNKHKKASKQIIDLLEKRWKPFK